MRSIAVTLFALLLAAFAAAEIGASSRRFDASPEAFAAFERRFNKRYATRADRDAAYAAFQTNMVRAAEAQARNPHATFGPTARADRAPKPRRPISLPKGELLPVRQRASGAFPPRKDWRDRGVLVPVQEMGECGGACVTIPLAEIGTALNMLNGFTRELTYLSPQQLLACTTDGMCSCNGCMPDDPIKDLIQNNDGIWDTAASYPYTAGTGNLQQCEAHNRSIVPGGRVKSFVSIPKMNQEALMGAVLASPIGVAVDATQWQLYTGGIMTDCGSSTYPDHAALLVGYDTEANPPYWLIQNEWGADWGEDGFIRIAMKNNTCYVQNEPFSLVMTGL